MIRCLPQGNQCGQQNGTLRMPQDQIEVWWRWRFPRLADTRCRCFKSFIRFCRKGSHSWWHGPPGKAISFWKGGIQGCNFQGNVVGSKCRSEGFEVFGEPVASSFTSMERQHPDRYFICDAAFLHLASTCRRRCRRRRELMDSRDLGTRQKGRSTTCKGCLKNHIRDGSESS